MHLNVFSATPQRGGKQTKSATATPGVLLGAVRMVKIDGSAWSNETVLMTINFAMSYLYGAKFPCHATTSNGEWSCTMSHVDFFHINAHLLALEHFALIFVHDFISLHVAVFEVCDGRLEVARVRQTISADRAQIRQLKSQVLLTQMKRKSDLQ